MYLVDTQKKKNLITRGAKEEFRTDFRFRVTSCVSHYATINLCMQWNVTRDIEFCRARGSKGKKDSELLLLLL